MSIFKKASNTMGKRMASDGHALIKQPEHPRAYRYGDVQEHIVVAEKVLGRFLPEGVVVHHVNGIPSDNHNSNLVICENDSYHQLLHNRTNAYRASGNPNYKKCRFCKQYDDPRNMWNSTTRRATAHHRLCSNIYTKKLKEDNKSVNIS